MYKVRTRKAIEAAEALACEDEKRAALEHIADCLRGVSLALCALDYEAEKNDVPGSAGGFCLLSQKDREDVARACAILERIETKRNEILRQLPNRHALFGYCDIG